MFFIKCDNAVFKVDGNQKCIKCKKTGEPCCFQHYCPQKKNFELLPSAETCKYNPKNEIKTDNEILFVDTKKELEYISEPKPEKAPEKQNFNKKHKFEKNIKVEMEDKKEEVKEEIIEEPINEPRIELVDYETETEAIETEDIKTEYFLNDDIQKTIEDVEEEIIESEEE